MMPPIVKVRLSNIELIIKEYSLFHIFATPAIKVIHFHTDNLYFITGFCRISHYSVHNQHQELYRSGPAPFPEFAEKCYRHLKIDYPKFHKMDNLCKLGFLGADILLKDKALRERYNSYDIGVILSNCNSSLDTDLRHHRQSQIGPASPAVFVYSLPNIVIGEICIRHNIKGENTFFIEKEYNTQHQVQYITGLLNSGTLKVCIGGWVEFLGDQFDCFLYLVENKNTNQEYPFTNDQIKKLYLNTDE